MSASAVDGRTNKFDIVVDLGGQRPGPMEVSSCIGGKERASHR